LETLKLAAAESQKLKSENEELKEVGTGIDKKRTELEGLTSRKEVRHPPSYSPFLFALLKLKDNLFE